MKNEKNLLETIAEGALAVLPIIGYYQGHSEGVKEGASRAGDCFEKRYNTLKQRYYQIQHDIFGEEAFLIMPDGWDEEYWLNLLQEFWVRQEKESLDAQALLIRFIDFCLEKFSPDRDRLAETCHQLETIRKVVAMSPAARLKAKRGDLELTIEFLSVFGNQREIKLFLSEKQSNIPTQAKIIFKGLLTLRNEINAAQDTSHGCNFLILGKTGTGKSSLLNYLIGEKYFRTDAGKPVTGRGIHKFSTIIDNIKATVYDSWGIEVGAADEWFEILRQEKQKHDLRQKVSEWFHSIIYCIQAGGHRVEPIDVDTINSFLAENYHVVIVLTKADLCSEEQENTLRKSILSECKLSNNSIIAVCSEKQIIRGTVHEPFGKEKLKDAILSGYIETIINILPKRCIYLAKEEISKFKERTTEEIDQLKYWDTSEAYVSWLRNKCQKFLDSFNTEIYPKIIDGEIKSALAINRNLASIIQYKGNIISDPPELEWWEKAIAVALGILAGVPIVLWMVVRSLFDDKIDKESADKLKKALDEFVTDINGKLDEDEPRLRNSFKSIFVAPKYLQ